MASIKTCDRCGEVIPKKKYTIFSRRFYYGGCVLEDIFDFIDFDDIDKAQKQYELCEKCTKELVEFLNPIDRKKAE